MYCLRWTGGLPLVRYPPPNRLRVTTGVSGRHIVAGIYLYDVRPKLSAVMPARHRRSPWLQSNVSSIQRSPTHAGVRNCTNNSCKWEYYSTFNIQDRACKICGRVIVIGSKGSLHVFNIQTSRRAGEWLYDQNPLYQLRGSRARAVCITPHYQSHL